MYNMDTPNKILLNANFKNKEVLTSLEYIPKDVEVFFLNKIKEFTTRRRIIFPYRITSHYLLYDEKHGRVDEVSKKDLNSMLEVEKIKFFKKDGYVMGIPRKYRPEMFEFIDDIKNIFSSLKSVANKVSIIDKIAKHESTPFVFMDSVILLVKILSNEKCTPLDVIEWSYSLFKIYHEGSKIMSEGVDLTSILLSFTALSVPNYILQRIEKLQKFTHVRIFDSDMALDLVRHVLDFVQSIFLYLETKKYVSPQYLDPMRKVLKYAFSSIHATMYMKQMSYLYARNMADSKLLFDITFRNEVMTFYERCKADLDFQVYLAENISAKRVWDAFKSNLILSIEAFDVPTHEVDPLCFVLEGLPGVGKSQLMAQLLQVFETGSVTMYNHVFPSIDEGKDFYDDYANQDVFTVDDVGAQGISQWSKIINLISPMKYPLPCAEASKKNTKAFNSKLLLTTTNNFMTLQGFTKTDCITEPGALFRRPHVFKMTIEEGVRKLTYFRYNAGAWVSEFIKGESYLKGKLPTSVVDDGQYSLAQYIFTCYKAIYASNKAHKQTFVINKDAAQKVALNVDNKMAELFPQSVNLLSMFDRGLDLLQVYGHTVKELFIESVEWLQAKVKQWLDDNKIIDKIIELSHNLTTLTVGNIKKFKIIFMALGGVLSTLIIGGILKPIFSGKKTLHMKVAFDNVRNDVSFRKSPSVVYNRSRGVILPQGDHQIEYAIKKFVKLVELKDENGNPLTLCHGVVSGRYIILPSHVVLEYPFVNIYSSYEHYQNGHKERENVKLVEERVYLKDDLCIYSMPINPALYKKNKFLFNDVSTYGGDSYLVNSMGVRELAWGTSLKKESHVKYSIWREKKYDIDLETAVSTPFSSNGACGSVLCNLNGIYGFHVAGDGEQGICVVPSLETAEDIRRIMNCDSSDVRFELDDAICPGISGVRVRYPEGDIPYNRVINQSSLIESPLHPSYNTDISEIAHAFDARVKVIPNFGKTKKDSKELLKSMSKKVMEHQGPISVSEMDFIEEYFDTLIPEFDDLDDYTTAFGNDDVPPLNKDSSNGFGYLPGKEAYFDFANKIIKDEAYERINGFDEENVDYLEVLSKETFKDETVKEEKQDKPRTFRVMPLGHIWWTKKIFGKLMQHFKECKHDTGISIGFNPYVDFAILAEKMMENQGFGDIDFKGWDGRLLMILMYIFYKCCIKKYRGNNVKRMTRVMETTWNSFVLADDEVWANTHGMPSGVWLTLLLNCFCNKGITALTVYRNKKNATVADVWRIVDYVMGDDKIFSVPKDLEEVFNLFTLQEVAQSLGMICTNGDKSAIDKPFQEFGKLEYLKRKFVQNPKLGKWMGSLSINTIMSMTAYVDKKKDYEIAMAGKMNAALVEAYLYPGLFERLRAVYKKSFPFERLFSLQECENILQQADYKKVLELAGKDVTWVSL